MPRPLDRPLRVAILGGGITGLSAAHFIALARERGARVEVCLIEGRGQVGGLIQTARVEDFVVEEGPDSFLTAKPEAITLSKELGLGSSLIGSNPTQRRTSIVHRGRLVPLPEDMVFFAPARLWPALTSPLFPISSKISILCERFSTRQRRVDDEPAAEFVRRHYGSGMLENVVQPLLAGIYGGEPEHLSARSVLPRFYELEQQYGSITRGIHQKAEASVSAAAPLFTTLRNGVGELTGALACRLDAARDSNAFRLCVSRKVMELRPLNDPPGGAGYSVHCAPEACYHADAVILALPAFECARLLDSVSARLGELLSGIPYTSAVTVALGYRESPRHPWAGFGFLVPRRERRRLLACTFVQNKFELRAPQGAALLRCFLGGERDPAVENLSDEEILRIVRGELRELLRLDAGPDVVHISRWPQVMPQYRVGHAGRVEAIREEIRKHPGLFIAGNAYAGVGISDCIRTAQAAAEELLQFAEQRRNAQINEG